ncbi:MAG TPA: hypothetical protein VK668_09990 [Mucilaginibacter sp.]|nr:hypothetical protein [Mucilaginibacter sp.]
MKSLYLIPVLLLFILCSCHNNEVKLLENGPKFSVNKGKKEVLDFNDPNTGTSASAATGDNKGGALNGSLNLASTSSAALFSKKQEPLIIVEDLPRSYKQRKFINNISEVSYDLFMIPGNIVKFNPKDTSYEFKTLKAIIKGNKPPVATTINDGMLYSAKINSNTSFNGSFLIGGLNVSKDEIMELNIQDAAKSAVPDSLIDVDVVKQVAESIPAEERKNYFYVKSVTLTLIDNRKYTEAKFDASINSCFVTAGGKTYSSNEKFQRERTISVFLVSLDNILSVPLH